MELNEGNISLPLLSQLIGLKLLCQSYEGNISLPLLSQLIGWKLLCQSYEGNIFLPLLSQLIGWKLLCQSYEGNISLPLLSQLIGCKLLCQSYCGSRSDEFNYIPSSFLFFSLNFSILFFELYTIFSIIIFSEAKSILHYTYLPG